MGRVTRAAVYMRVSTKQQSVELQQHDLLEYVKARGWDWTEFVDEGVSGRRDRRPAMNCLMKAVRRRRYQAVVVWRFDRFARSVRHLVTALEEFRSLGVQFISHQEALDSGTPMGAAMFTIIAAMSALEADVLRERTVAGIEVARRNGRQIGGVRIPLDTGDILRRRAAGHSIRRIARALGTSPATIWNRLREAGRPGLNR